jgi:hypothetical protein
MHLNSIHLGERSIPSLTQDCSTFWATMNAIFLFITLRASSVEGDIFCALFQWIGTGRLWAATSDASWNKGLISRGWRINYIRPATLEGRLIQMESMYGFPRFRRDRREFRGAGPSTERPFWVVYTLRLGACVIRQFNLVTCTIDKIITSGLFFFLLPCQATIPWYAQMILR